MPPANGVAMIKTDHQHKAADKPASTNETPLLVRIRLFRGCRKTHQPRFPYTSTIRQGFPFALYLYIAVRFGPDSEYAENTCFPSSSRPVPRKGFREFWADFRGNPIGLFSVCLPMRTGRGVSLVGAKPRRKPRRSAIQPSGKLKKRVDYARAKKIAPMFSRLNPNLSRMAGIDTSKFARSI
jgi:hypothetical protein